MLRVSLVLLFAALGAFPQVHTQARYEISGTVVDHRTKAPLDSVMVSITSVNTRAETLSVVTSADGTFHFVGLAQGKYALTAERRGQQQQLLHAHGQFSTAVAAGPDIDSQHIVFPLFGDARIAGNVTDEDGDPVGGAQVFLLRKNALDGASRVDMYSQTNTTISGAFHFGHLKAGTYYLAVSARPWYAGNVQYVSHPDANGTIVNETIAPPPVVDRVYPVTYSGDTTDSNGAQAINLTEGSSLTVPININAVTSVHVAIPEAEVSTPVVSAGRMPRQMGGFSVTAMGPGGVEIPTQTMFMGRGAGEQEITVAPGTYRVNHHVPGPNGDSVASDDVINVGSGGSALVSKTSSTDVTGHVIHDGSAIAGNVVLQILGNRHNQGTLIQSDGSFAFQQSVPPGRYRLVIASETDLAVHAVGEGKQTTAGNTLVIPADPPNTLDISVIAGSALASVFSGTAVRDGKPVAGAMILLLPDQISEGAAIGRDQSDSDGTFSIPNVQPGRYTLLAFDCDTDDDSCGIEYRDPTVMKPYLSQGQTFTVPVAGKNRIEVPVIHFAAHP